MRGLWMRVGVFFGMCMCIYVCEVLCVLYVSMYGHVCMRVLADWSVGLFQLLIAISSVGYFFHNTLCWLIGWIDGLV